MSLTMWVDSTRGTSPIEHLFSRFSVMYGTRFTSQFGDAVKVEGWKAVWSEALADDGVTFDEVKTGLAVCRRQHDWPPTLPEFVKACRPSMDYEAAFLEAVREMQVRRNVVPGKPVNPGKWSSPAVYWAAVRLGSDLSAMPYVALKARWKDALDAAQREGLTTIPDPVPALAAPGQVVVAPEVAHKRITDLVTKLRLA